MRFRFIEVTVDEAGRLGGFGSRILINIDHIVLVRSAGKGGSAIFLTDWDDDIHVKESFFDLMEALER